MEKSVHSLEQQVLQDLLRHLRKERGLRQIDLADRLGKPASFICRFEKGNVMLDMPQLRHISCALGMTLRELIDRYETALEKKGL